MSDNSTTSSNDQPITSKPPRPTGLPQGADVRGIYNPRLETLKLVQHQMKGAKHTQESQT